MSDTPSGPSGYVHGSEERWRYQVRKLKDVITTLTAERDRHKTQAEKLEAERVELTKKADDSESVNRVAELEDELRTIKHKAVFNRLATELGIRDDARDDLFILSGYKPEGDVPDEEKIKNMIENEKAKRAYLQQPVQPKVLVPPKPGPASGQGGRAAGNTSGFQLPGDDDPRWNDSVWQWNNRKEIAEAINERFKNGQV